MNSNNPIFRVATRISDWQRPHIVWWLSDLFSWAVFTAGRTRLVATWLKRFHLPLVIKIQLVAVSLALISALAVATLSGHGGYKRVAFAIPANVMALPSWESGTEELAVRINRAFGVGNVTATEFSDWIMEASERQALSPELIASVVFTESSFRKSVTSHVGAIGPAQVRPDYWSEFCGSDNLSDPAENIYCGAQILSYFKDACGGESCALEAYNVGPATRDDSYYADAGRRYVSKIDRHKRKLETTQL